MTEDMIRTTFPFWSYLYYLRIDFIIGLFIGTLTTNYLIYRFGEKATYKEAILFGICAAVLVITLYAIYKYCTYLSYIKNI